MECMYSISVSKWIFRHHQFTVDLSLWHLCPSCLSLNTHSDMLIFQSYKNMIGVDIQTPQLPLPVLFLLLALLVWTHPWPTQEAQSNSFKGYSNAIKCSTYCRLVKLFIYCFILGLCGGLGGACVALSISKFTETSILNIIATSNCGLFMEINVRKYARNEGLINLKNVFHYKYLYKFVSFSHSYELLRLQQKIDEGEIEIAGLDNMEADLHTKHAEIHRMQEQSRSLMNLHRFSEGNWRNSEILWLCVRPNKYPPKEQVVLFLFYCYLTLRCSLINWKEYSTWIYCDIQWPEEKQLTLRILLFEGLCFLVRNVFLRHL